MTPLTRSRRWIMAALGALSVVAGLVVANLKHESGDNYCGSVFSDTNWGPACNDTLFPVAVLSVVLVVLGLAALLAAATADKSGRDRMLAIAAFGLAVVGGASLLLAVNRLVEPTDDAWCGSVVNRHRSYDPEVEAKCDRALAPARRQASIAAGVGGMALAGAATLERQRRRA